MNTSVVALGVEPPAQTIKTNGSTSPVLKKKKKNKRKSFRRLMRDLKKPMTTESERQKLRQERMDAQMPKIEFKKVDKI